MPKGQSQKEVLEIGRQDNLAGKTSKEVDNCGVISAIQELSRDLSL